MSDLLSDNHEISELLEETHAEYPKHTRRLASQVNPHTYTTIPNQTLFTTHFD